MMGYEPHALPSVISDTIIPMVETRLKILSATRDEALATHELVHQVMAACTYRSFSPFKLRAKVWLEARNLNSQPKVHPQTRRTPHYYKSPIPNHLSTLPTKNVENPPCLPCITITVAL